MPAISVVMPVYNAAPFLKESVESILHQTFSDFEFLIFEDGSTDDSKSILESFVDPRIRITHFEQNQGYVKLLNLGLAMATGKYIARMDADDISHITRFEKQFEFLENNPEYVICGSDYTHLGANRKVSLPSLNEEIKLKMLSITPFCHPSVMLRAAVLKEKNIFYEEPYMPAEDLKMWVQLSGLGKFRNLSESLLWYRVHDHNISFKPRTQQEQHFLSQTKRTYIHRFFNNASLSLEEEAVMSNFILGSKFDYNALVEVRNLLRKIIKKHFEYPVEERVVHHYLIRRYFYCCTISTNEGIKVFLLANSLGFFSIPMYLNIKLLVKSIIRYRV